MIKYDGFYTLQNVLLYTIAQRNKIVQLALVVNPALAVCRSS